MLCHVALGKYLLSSQQVAVAAAAAPSLESSLFSLVLETAFPGLRKRAEAVSVLFAY